VVRIERYLRILKKTLELPHTEDSCTNFLLVKNRIERILQIYQGLRNGGSIREGIKFYECLLTSGSYTNTHLFSYCIYLCGDLYQGVPKPLIPGTETQIDLETYTDWVPIRTTMAVIFKATSSIEMN
jgi:hypothetical protein